MSEKVNIFKNPVSLLQETAIRLGRIPAYKYEEIKTQEFKCTVTLCDMTVESIGKGKKSAKILAAEGMLQKLGIVTGSANLVDIPGSSMAIVQPSCSGSAPTCPSLNARIKRPSSPLISSSPNKSTCLSKLIESHDKHFQFSISHSSNNGFEQSSISSDKSVGTGNVGSLKESDGNDPIQRMTEFDKEDETDILCNPVSVLQNKAAMFHEVPKYNHLATENFGMKNVMYFFEVTALKQSAVGSGSSKKEAKSNAASSLLSILGYECVESPSNVDIKDNLVGKLQEFCQLNYVNKIPSYTVEEKEVGNQKMFTMTCKIGTFSVKHSALNKKLAKQLCAREMLEVLEKNKMTKEFDNIAFESKILDKSINDIAWQKLSECHLRVGKVNLDASLTSIPLKEYPYLFRNNFFGTSDTLVALKLSDKSDIYNLTDHGVVLCGILDELSIKHEMEVMSSKVFVAVNLLIKSQPPWSFIEIQKTKEEAEKALYVKALEFLYDMQ